MKTSVVGCLSVWIVLGVGSAAPAVEFEARAGAVVALEGEAVLWENVHDRREQFRDERTPGHLVGPVLAGDWLYYATGISLYQAAPETGVVRRRFPLPAPCSRLDVEGEEVLVSIQSARADLPWSRTYRVGAETGHIPFFLSGDLLAVRMTRSDAEAVLRSLRLADPEADPRAPKLDADGRGEPELGPFLETAVEELGRLAERDPTNPWYLYWKATHLLDLDRGEEAMAAFRAALSLSREYDFELLAMAIPLGRVSSELGDEAFERGMRFLVGHGYDPEMMGTLISVLVHYGRPQEELDPARDLARLDRLGERIWDLAPHCEGAAYMFHGLAEAHRRGGDPNLAGLWDERAREALPYRVFGFGGPQARLTGPALNVLFASILCVLLVLLVKGLRYSSAQRRATGLARWNPFAFWTRGEILGFLAVQALLTAATLTATRGIATVGVAVGLPIASLSGNFGHPDGVASTARFQGSPEGDFVHALALQKAARHREAATIYERLDTPEALNNLGVIRHASGKEADARRLFERARTADPGLLEAAHNLGEAVSSPRLDRARKYGHAGPLYAMPSIETWGAALAGPFELENPFELFGVIEEISLLGESEAGELPVRTASLLDPSALLFLMGVLLCVLAILGLIVRAPTTVPADRSSVSLVGWLGGFLVPGTARQLGLLGAPLLALCAFSALVHYSLAASGGIATNLLDAIALPSISGAYGIGEILHDPLEKAIRRCANLWWMLWVGNLIVVALLERISPDPLGPFAKEG